MFSAAIVFCVIDALRCAVHKGVDLSLPNPGVLEGTVIPDLAAEAITAFR